MLHSGAVSHDDTTHSVRAFTLAFGVDAGEIEGFPDLLQQRVHVEVQFAAHDDRVRQTGEPVNLLNGDLVDLVVDVEAAHVLPLPNDNINELICGTRTRGVSY